MNDIDFERIYNAYAGDVWRVCVCYFGSCRADAEDASQITFTKLLTSPPDTDDIQRIKGWLLVTAGNVCKDMLRSRHRRNIPLDSLYRSQKCSVVSACSMWIKNSFADNIRDSFYNAIEDIYDSGIFLAPFDKSTVDSVNAWCEKTTNGMIKEIINDIPDNTVMLLANALVFEADWQKVFEGEPVKTTFYGLRGETEVDMMSEDAVLDLMQDETCTGFLKKYDGGRYAFAALIPNDKSENIYSFAASLGTGRWRYLFDTSFSAYAKIHLPCFTADYSDADMIDKLADIGYSALLDKNADFAGILKTPVDGSFYVGNISHAVHIEVTRFGTRAAGVTMGSLGLDSVPEYYIDLNRPFVYAIVDMQTGSMLFVGIITDI